MTGRRSLRRRPFFWVLVAGVLAFVPGLFVGIHADDWFHIRPRSGEQVAATFTGDWNQGNRGEGGFYRPLVRTLFGAERMVWGEAAAGYHLTNGILFCVILLGVFRGGVYLNRGKGGLAAVLVIAVIAANPVKNEALYWISGRTDLLAAALVVWAFAWALRALDEDRPGWAWGALGLLAGGLMSKEVALAGCLAVPFAAWLLRPRVRLRAWELVLLAGPLILGVVYLLFRGAVLGGLAGYEQEPRRVGEFLESIGLCLSGLMFPWQADAVSGFRWWLAIPGLLFAGLLLFASRFGRGPVVCGGAMLLALLPAGFLQISPVDGMRVLLLPLCFQALFLIAVLRGSAMTSLPGMGVIAVLAISLQPVNVSILSDFVRARGANARVVDSAWEYMQGLPPGTVFVVPEPPGSDAFARRILEPGAALMMAMQARWMALDGAETEEQVDGEAPRLVLRLTRPGGEVLLAHALQPWMQRDIRHLVFGRDGELGVLRLERTRFESAQSLEESLLEAALHSNEIVAWAAVVESAPEAAPFLRATLENGLEPEMHGEYVDMRGPGVVWMDTVGLSGSVGATVRFYPGVDEESLRLRHLHRGRYVWDVEQIDSSGANDGN